MAGKFSRGGGVARRMGVRIAGVLAGFLALALVIVGYAHLHGGTQSPPPAPAVGPSSTAPSASAAPTPSTTVPVPRLTAAQLAALPRSTTFTTVRRTALSETAVSDGNVVRIAKSQPVFASPGGRAVAVVPATQLGLDTWLPVVARQSGWLQVRLPSRPNGALAWVPAAGMRTAQTDWRVTVSLRSGLMTITQGASRKGSWSIGHGRAATPTPVGQTFLLAGFVDPTQNFSPVIYALGAHSATLDSFGGGPGTVAVHGWPTPSGRVGEISHGCLRVPASALGIFAKLPTGTPVDITAT